MRWVAKICFLVLAPGLMLAQTTAQNAPSDPTSVATELKALREAMAQQQQQIAQQQQQIDKLTKALDEKTAGTPHVENATLTTNAPATANAVASDVQEEKPKESPLSFRIGAAEFTPGGFVDFENVFRTTNTGNVTATNFWAIPYSTQGAAGHLTEYRATGQYSRFNLRTHAKYGQNDITGYFEFDFNGNDAANVFVTSNPHTNRIRLYWLDLKRDKWEFLGGQTWGLQTPNRVGLSPNPADLFTTLGEDAQTHVGINYTRAAEFRATYHFNDNFQWAAAIQNPNQFGGPAVAGINPVTLPASFNAILGPQIDFADKGTVANITPDVHTKFAYDTSVMGGRHFHFEGGGLLTTAKVTVVPTAPGSTFHSHSTVGGGFDTALNFDLLNAGGRNLRFIGNGMWGYGVGRYLIGMGPQFVVVPVQTGPATFDVRTSGVHSGDVVLGFEAQPFPKTQLGAYYGGAYFQRNFFGDLTAAGAGPCGGKPCIGFGFPGSNAVATNRAIQEGTIDWTQTFWKNPQYGAVLLVTQASYVTRAPWSFAAGAPKNAHLTMGYVSLRYILP